MKAFLSSVLISGGLYFGYQLKLGPYSGKGEILEVKVPAKRFLYYETQQSYYKSEIEVSKFIEELKQKNIFGTFHKVQLSGKDDQSGFHNYVIGIEETMENMNTLKQYHEKLKVADIPSYPAVEVSLNYDKKSFLLVAMQMTFNVQNSILNFVKQNEQKFKGINPEVYLKSVTIGTNKKLLQTSISYPFGEGMEIYQDLNKKGFQSIQISQQKDQNIKNDQNKSQQ
ncbi:hypothetical protein ABPG74_011822 [Tetrahymena malaccensis]